VARYDDVQGYIVEEHNGEVEGRAVMVRRSAGYSDFSVSDHCSAFNIIFQFPHLEIATISEVRQKYMVSIFSLDR